ncbi:hypothetical protein BCR34DRAFT_593319 [Clohesyomyces aquaticus]|uniref:Uncharacterized protein n=1 Tax=Clohesyomyces aquaticus TaxID=1231657 RepID=A0A1Y1YJJ3_9PLEO|nr:hypothetical protein BCR34DRAFT_593319 [Clohesyomyces aquaticus]
MAGRTALQPTCEDYHSDESETVDSFRRSPINQANVTAKRSHPSDLGSDQPQQAEKTVNANIDMQSDSGYSSHTAATMSSADSAPSAKSQSPPVVAANMNMNNMGPRPPASPAPRRERERERRPTMEDRKSSRAERAERAERGDNSPRKPLGRSGSVSSRQQPARERKPTLTRDPEECTNPNCTKCGPNANVRGRRPAPSPLDSGLDVSYPPFDQREQQRSRRDSYIQQSPTYTTRRPPSHHQDEAVVQPSRTQRRSSSTARPARPVSYHANSTQDYSWGQPMPFPTPPPERGPPPSASALFNLNMQQHMPPPQMGPYGMMGGTPPNFFTPSPMQMSPPYDVPATRPPMPRAPSSNYNTRRPTSQYGQMLPPLITHQDQQNMPSARHGQAPQAPQSARRAPQSAWEPEYSDEGSSEEDNDRALMPPPNIVPARRPSVGPRSRTTQVYEDDRMSRSMMLPERHREQDPRASRVATNPAPSRSTSVARRPSIKQKAQSSYQTPTAQVLVENSKSRRRQSYMGHEQEPELKAKHRDSKIYQSEVREPKRYHNNRNDAVALTGHRRRHTEQDPRRREEYIAESKLSAAEEYQQKMRGSDVPLTEQAHKAAKRTSRIISGDSRSRNSDEGSRISRSNHTTVTSSGNNGEIRLRVDPSMGLSLQLNGDNEGRTIQLHPAEDGMADIVISGPRGNENMYRSDRVSVAGSRKAIMPSSARREAEDSSTRSTRSSQTRRERERESERPRPLRRARRETQYED